MCQDVNQIELAQNTVQYVVSEPTMNFQDSLSNNYSPTQNHCSSKALYSAVSYGRTKLRELRRSESSHRSSYTFWGCNIIGEGEGPVIS